jgi:hypothetical protein
MFKNILFFIVLNIFFKFCFSFPFKNEIVFQDKSKRSAVSSSSLSLVSSGSKTGSTIVNLAKPDSVQQLLPFKLSESESGIAAGISGSIRSGKSSPKQQPQQQRYHQV